MSTTDIILLTVAVISGMMSLGYALFRHDAEEEKRKVLKFWLEIFTLCAILLAVRIFYVLFPAVPPDKFFLGCTVLAGGMYVYYKLTRRDASEEKKKATRLARDAFLCLLLVFVFRGFFFDWFRIPSNSMQPTLAVGDLVLTDKNHYGYRLPVFNTRLTPGAPPARGEIIVFRKPGDSLFYIKRIIGIPGDTVRYGDDKSLTINGERLSTTLLADSAAQADFHLRENIGGGWHDIFIDDRSSALFHPPHPDHCRLNQSPVAYILTCDVPPGHYFVLGDNRDRSNDSRFWGFVPEDHIVGPASRVIFNHRVITGADFSKLQRTWLPLALERE